MPSIYIGDTKVGGAYINATSTKDGLMSKYDKQKLDKTPTVFEVTNEEYSSIIPDANTIYFITDEAVPDGMGVKY